MGDSRAKLHKILVDAKLSTAVINFITGPPPAGLGLDCTADFANYFKADDYTAELRQVISKIPEHPEDRLQEARLRAAYTLAVAEFQLLTNKRANGNAKLDFDQPLDPDDKKAQEGLFCSLYGGLHFEPCVYPNDSMIARFYNEFLHNCLSIP